MKHEIGFLEYVLVGCGILLIPAFGLGLILIGVAIYRIGCKMEQHKKKTDEELKKYDIDFVDENVLKELR